MLGFKHQVGTGENAELKCLRVMRIWRDQRMNREKDWELCKNIKMGTKIGINNLCKIHLQTPPAEVLEHHRLAWGLLPAESWYNSHGNL